MCVRENVTVWHLLDVTFEDHGLAGGVRAILPNHRADAAASMALREACHPNPNSEGVASWWR